MSGRWTVDDEQATSKFTLESVVDCEADDVHYDVESGEEQRHRRLRWMRTLFGIDFNSIDLFCSEERKENKVSIPQQKWNGKKQNYEFAAGWQNAEIVSMNKMWGNLPVSYSDL